MTKKEILKLDKLLRQALLEEAGEYARCPTCGRVYRAKELTVGHYITRARRVTRWDRRNVELQCVRCNIYQRGKPVEFREYLVKKWGEDVVRRLERASRVTGLKLTYEDVIKSWWRPADLVPEELLTDWSVS